MKLLGAIVFLMLSASTGFARQSLPAPPPEKGPAANKVLDIIRDVPINPRRPNLPMRGSVISLPSGAPPNILRGDV